jgi:hypothetical protein
LEQTKINKEEKTTYKLEIDIANPIKQRGKKKTRGGGGNVKQLRRLKRPLTKNKQCLKYKRANVEV